MRYLLVGGSRGLGRSIAIMLRQADHDLFLVSSSADTLSQTVTAIEPMGEGILASMAMDMRRLDVTKLVKTVSDEMGEVDGVLYVAGATDSLDPGTDPVDDLTRINFSSAVAVIEAYLPIINAAEGGDIVLIGSIRSARGGREKIIYSATKAALERYGESLVARLDGRKMRVQVYRMGFIDTGMTPAPTILPKLDPGVAAHKIVRNLGSKHGVYTLPWWWRPIYELLRWAPAGIIRKLGI